MSHRFDPNTNPFADDLLRLGMAPSSRYSPRERQIFARILAAKIYGLRFRGDVYYPGDWHWIRIDNDLHNVEIAVLFDSDFPTTAISTRFGGARDHLNLIVLTVGSKGVVEIFNGRWHAFAAEQMLREMDAMDSGEQATNEDADGRIPPRSDDELMRDYAGLGQNDPDRGPPRDGGGDGGGSDGGDGIPPGGGDGGFPGAGGIRELLDHPVLLTVNEATFDEILEQT